MGRRAERVPVRPIGAWTPSQPVGCQGDILLCSKGARRWAPLRAPPRLRSPTGTRQTRQCLRYCFQTGVRRYEYHANPALGATSPRDVVLVGTIRQRRLRPANFRCSGLRRSTSEVKGWDESGPRPDPSVDRTISGRHAGEIRENTGWDVATVRGFLSTAAKKHSLQTPNSDPNGSLRLTGGGFFI